MTVRMVMTARPEAVGSTTARLRGVVAGEPVGAPVFEVEEFRPEQAPVVRDFRPLKSVPAEMAGEDAAATVDGLAPHTQYRVRLVVDGRPGSWQGFSTDPGEGEPDPLEGVAPQGAAPGGAGPGAVALGSAAAAAALAGEPDTSAGLAGLRGLAVGSKAVVEAIASADRADAELLAASAVLSSFDRVMEAQGVDTERDAVDAIANEFPDLSERERVVIVGEEVERERTFRAKARERMARDVRQALAIREAAERERKMRQLLEREERYAKQRRKAVLMRSLGRVEKERVREASPDGAYWALSPYVKQHTADCMAMAGKVWPWQVLESVFPPLHGECPCQLLPISEAQADGLPGADDVVPVDRAWLLASQALAMEHEDEGRVAEALQEDGVAPELFRWEPDVVDGDPFGLRIEEAVRRGRRAPERYAKGTSKGGEFKPRRGAMPGAPTRRRGPRMPDLSIDAPLAAEAIGALRDRGQTRRARDLEVELDGAVRDGNGMKAAAVRKRATDALAGAASVPAAPAADGENGRLRDGRPAPAVTRREIEPGVFEYAWDGEVKIARSKVRYEGVALWSAPRNPQGTPIPQYTKSVERAKLVGNRKNRDALPLGHVEIRDAADTREPDRQPGGTDADRALYGPLAGSDVELPRFGPEDRYELRFTQGDPARTMSIDLWDREGAGGKGSVYATWDEWDLDRLEAIAKQQNDADRAQKAKTGVSRVTPAGGPQLAKLEQVPTAAEIDALVKMPRGRTPEAGEIVRGVVFDPNASRKRTDGDTLVLGTGFFTLKRGQRESVLYRHLADRLHAAQDDDVQEWRYRPKEVGDAYVSAATGNIDGLREQRPELLKDVVAAAEARGLPVSAEAREWAAAGGSVDADGGLETPELRDLRAMMTRAEGDPGMTPGLFAQEMLTRGAVDLGMERQGQRTLFDPVSRALVELRFDGEIEYKATPLAPSTDSVAQRLAADPTVDLGTLQSGVPGVDRLIPVGGLAGSTLYGSSSGRRLLVTEIDGQQVPFEVDVPEALRSDDFKRTFPSALSRLDPTSWPEGIPAGDAKRALKQMSGVEPTYRQGPGGTRLWKATTPAGELMIEADGTTVRRAGYVSIERPGTLVSAEDAKRELVRKAQAERDANGGRLSPDGLPPAAREVYDAGAALLDEVAAKRKLSPASRKTFEAQLGSVPFADAEQALKRLGAVSDATNVRRNAKFGAYSFVTEDGLQVRFAPRGFLATPDTPMRGVEVRLSEHAKGRGRLAAGETWKNRQDMYSDLIARSKVDAERVGLYSDVRAVFDENPGAKNAAATHSWAGVVRMSPTHVSGKQVDEFLKKREAGTATDLERQAFAATLKTFVHELEHGKHRRGKEFESGDYVGAGKAIEEAITEEAALHETMAVLRERGMQDVEIAVRRAYVSGLPLAGGSYRDYRTRMAHIFDAGDVPYDRRERLVRQMRGQSATERVQTLAEQLHGVVEGTDEDRRAAVRNIMGGGLGLDGKRVEVPTTTEQRALVLLPELPPNGFESGDPLPGQRVRFRVNGEEHEGRVSRVSSLGMRVVRDDGTWAYVDVNDPTVTLGDLDEIEPFGEPITVGGREVRPGDAVRVNGRGEGTFLISRGDMVGIRCEDGVILWYSAGSPALKWGS